LAVRLALTLTLASNSPLLTANCKLQTFSSLTSSLS
jgi:hypothetical protein